MKHKISILETINIEQIKINTDFFTAKFYPSKIFIPRDYNTYSAS